MCLAIVLNPNVEISKEVLQQGFKANDDGAGFGFYVNRKSPVIKKGYTNFEAFYAAFVEERERHKDKTFLIHFRIRSRGAINTSMCHPFQMKHAMLIHNGTINGLGSYRDGKSDTAEFAELLHKVPPGRFTLLARKLKSFLDWSRVAVLTKEGNVVFMGNEGTWEEGVWYSNMFWKRLTPPVSNHGAGMYNRGGMPSRMRDEDDDILWPYGHGD